MFRKCKNCNKKLLRTSGRNKLIINQRDSDFYCTRLKKQFEIGDWLCGRCRIYAHASDTSANTSQSAFTFPNPMPCTGLESTPSVVQYSPLLSMSSPSVTASDEEFIYNEKTVVEIPMRRVVCTHKYFFICGANRNLTRVGMDTRVHVYKSVNIYIPQGNRCCRSHLIGSLLFEDSLIHLRVNSNTTSLTENELSVFLKQLSIKEPSSLFEKISDKKIQDKEMRVLTGLCWDEINELSVLLKSMRNSAGRTVSQALVIFLFKLRTGSSNSVVSTVFGLKYYQQVSSFFDEVLKCFEKDILPVFGLNNLSRSDLLAHTSYTAKKLLKSDDDQLILICDGTYVRHNEYQRKSYSGQKKTHLCKPFTVFTTNGFVIDFFGPFNGTMYDASIMKEILKVPGLRNLLKPKDVFVLDRGFRDVVNHISEQGFIAHMPCLKGNRAQVPTEEANMSRRVTKIRWVVEAVHGAIAQKYGLLHHNLDNKFLPKLPSICKIIAFLHNKFGKRLATYNDTDISIVEYVESRMLVPNTLSEEVENQRWNRRKTKLSSLTATELLDFPRLSEDNFKMLFTASYQLSLAISYLAEIMDERNQFNILYVKESPNILRLDVRSRHINKKMYHLYIDYNSGGSTIEDIKRYCCDCAIGLRTVGCCSHIACCIYYLAHARYLSRIIRPAEILSNIFYVDNTNVVINENSDDDD